MSYLECDVVHCLTIVPRKILVIVAANSKARRADYGIDAPAVIRNLFLAGAAGISFWSIARLAVWSGRIHATRPFLGSAGAALVSGTGFILMGLWMLLGSTITKRISRDRLLERIPWKGHEQVLDVGCGRGLLLIGAARRLSTGTATGIDIWQAEDLTGNCGEAVLENARREGVAHKVDVQTADMRRIPFAGGVFDVVISRAAIHNIYSATEREKAISEIARVLKPGGIAVISDIRHLRQYADVFRRNGCSNVRRSGSWLMCLFFMLVTFGSLRPGILLVQKSSGQG
jgi:SAM-dependent methyltransferase